MTMDTCDLLVIGGGINGAGIARDAAGRGLAVTLVEQDDIASATSGWSSKLVHGGLRYLEHYEFRLVREALAEREVLLSIAPHLVRPLRVVLPHDAGMRPVWMVRIGLWLYDHLGKRVSLPGSMAVRFPHVEFSAGLKSDYRDGFVYADCRVDDARLTLANALSAKAKGATILTRTRFVGAKREGDAWIAEIENVRDGTRRTVKAKAIANVAGPWVADVLQGLPAKRTGARVRLVKGSHIVVPKVHSGGHAYILQNTDKRVVFVIPFEDEWSLIGTTDVPVDDVSRARDITPEETRYLLAAANRYLDKSLSEKDVVWSYAGVRPLYDDGKSDPSAITRDYVFELDGEAGAPPVSCRRPTRAFRGSCSNPSRAATAAGPRRSSRARRSPRTWARPSARASRRGRWTTSSRTSGPRAPRTCCGAAPSAACTWTRPSARRSRPTSPRRSEAPRGLSRGRARRRDRGAHGHRRHPDDRRAPARGRL